MCEICSKLTIKTTERRVLYTTVIKRQSSLCNFGSFDDMLGRGSTKKMKLKHGWRHCYIGLAR